VPNISSRIETFYLQIDGNCSPNLFDGLENTVITSLQRHPAISNYTGNFDNDPPIVPVLYSIKEIIVPPSSSIVYNQQQHSHVQYGQVYPQHLKTSLGGADFSTEGSHVNNYSKLSNGTMLVNPPQKLASEDSLIRAIDAIQDFPDCSKSSNANSQITSSLSRWALSSPLFQRSKSQISHDVQGISRNSDNLHSDLRFGNHQTLEKEMDIQLIPPVSDSVLDSCMNSNSMAGLFFNLPHTSAKESNAFQMLSDLAVSNGFQQQPPSQPSGSVVNKQTVETNNAYNESGKCLPNSTLSGMKSSKPKTSKRLSASSPDENSTQKGSSKSKLSVKAIPSGNKKKKTKSSSNDLQSTFNKAIQEDHRPQLISPLPVFDQHHTASNLMADQVEKTVFNVHEMGSNFGSFPVFPRDDFSFSDFPTKSSNGNGIAATTVESPELTKSIEKNESAVVLNSLGNENISKSNKLNPPASKPLPSGNGLLSYNMGTSPSMSRLSQSDKLNAQSYSNLGNIIQPNVNSNLSYTNSGNDSSSNMSRNFAHIFTSNLKDKSISLMDHIKEINSSTSPLGSSSKTFNAPIDKNSKESERSGSNHVSKSLVGSSPATVATPISDSERDSNLTKDDTSTKQPTNSSCLKKQESRESDRKSCSPGAVIKLDLDAMSQVEFSMKVPESSNSISLNASRKLKKENGLLRKRKQLIEELHSDHSPLKSQSTSIPAEKVNLVLTESYGTLAPDTNQPPPKKLREDKTGVLPKVEPIIYKDLPPNSFIHKLLRNSKSRPELRRIRPFYVGPLLNNRSSSNNIHDNATHSLA
jgi:hypothetical protein